MKKIKLSKSIVGQLEKNALSSVIDNGYLGMGVFVQQFEDRLKEYLNAKYVVCVNSGTAALHLALMAAGLKEGDEILVQSLTYIATFQAITAAGIKPVPCEIMPETCTIDLRDSERKITEKTRAIMPVYYASRAIIPEEIYKFAHKHNLRVIEDAAHAFGTVYKGKKIGALQLFNQFTSQPPPLQMITCFSFDGIKNITSGEGGAVVTDSDEVARFIMDARLLGIQKETSKRYQSMRSWEFDVTHQGYRYHMSNLFAAIGIVQLERFEKEFKPKRQMLAKRYNEALKGIPDIVLFSDNYDDTVPHIFPVKILKNKRNGLRQYLLDNNIECGIHYYPNHLLSYFGARKGELPVTEHIYKELITLPLHPDLSIEDQNRVIDCVTYYLNKN